MSPFAGQASLRVLETRNVTEATSSLPWIAGNSSGIDEFLSLQNPLLIKASYISAMLGASIIAIEHETAVEATDLDNL